MVRDYLMATVLFFHGFDNYLSLSMRGRYNNVIDKWKWRPTFQNKVLRHARADELELYSSTYYFTSKAQTPTYVEVLL